MPSLVEIGPPVLKIFEGFLPYIDHGDHLGHVTWIIHRHIGFPFLKLLHIKFGFDWPSSFREEGL